LLFNKSGCSVATRRESINISSKPVAAFTTGNANQCLVGNRFVFTNSSTNEPDTMMYSWKLGDGTEATTKDITYSYKSPGNYIVKMTVSSNPGCVDSSELAYSNLSKRYCRF
jgi:PKD repeat protein